MLPHTMMVLRLSADLKWEHNMKKEHMWWVAAFLLGVIVAPMVRSKVPLANKLPSV